MNLSDTDESPFKEYTQQSSLNRANMDAVFPFRTGSSTFHEGVLCQDYSFYTIIMMTFFLV